MQSLRLGKYGGQDHLQSKCPEWPVKTQPPICSLWAFRTALFTVSRVDHLAGRILACGTLRASLERSGICFPQTPPPSQRVKRKRNWRKHSKQEHQSKLLKIILHPQYLFLNCAPSVYRCLQHAVMKQMSEVNSCLAVEEILQLNRTNKYTQVSTLVPILSLMNWLPVFWSTSLRSILVLFSNLCPDLPNHKVPSRFLMHSIYSPISLIWYSTK
jgi:hypothetical protein